MHISIPNAVFMLNGKIVQLDELLVLEAKQRAEDNVESVKVSVEVEGKYVKVTTSEPVNSLGKYVLTLSTDGKTYTADIGTSGKYDMNSLFGTVPEGRYSVTAHAESIFGKTSTESSAVESYVLPPCAPMTLRFQFSRDDYDPSELKSTKWNKGDWTHRVDNIWDWTYNDTNWATAFGGGDSKIPGAFSDASNTVKVIDCGNTSSVTDFSKFFQNCTAVTEVLALDTSGATTVTLLFSHCEAMYKVCDLDFSNSTDNRATFQCAYSLVNAPNIKFSSTKPYTCQYLFVCCKSLKHMPKYNLTNCTSTAHFIGALSKNMVVMEIEELPEFSLDNVTDMAGMFYNCQYLKSVTLKKLYNVVNMNHAFVNCESLTHIEIDGLCNVTKMSFTFFGCSSLTELPWMNIGTVTTLENAFDKCTSLTDVPEYDTHSCTNFDATFERCPNLRHAPRWNTSAATTFANCFSGTESGVNGLEEIPDWDFSSASLFDNMFKNNPNLKSVSGLRLPNATNVDQILKGCRKVESGIAELYEHLSTKTVAVTSHNDAFLNCGVDTETGAAELATIPDDWK